MSGTKKDARASTAQWKADDSYDRYKRPRWKPALLFAAMVTLLLAFSIGTYQPRLLVMSLLPSSMLSLDQRVETIMALHPLIDGHDDLAEKIRHHFQNHIYDAEFRARFETASMPDHFDLARMRTGRAGGMFFSCWVDCPANKFDFSNENYAPVVIEALAQMDVIHRVQAAYPDVFSLPTLDSSSALSAFRHRRRFISPIGLEGLHMIGRNASTLRAFHKLGVKYSTLTWNCHNAFADAAQVIITDEPLAPDAARPATPHWGGLSPLGTDIIREMNRLGIMVDLSHTHAATMHDVLAGNATKGFPGSRAPVIFSHSSAFALCPHPRNVPDYILPLVKQTQSVVMVTFVPQFASCVNSTVPHRLPTFYPANSTLEWVAEHIMYIGNKIGFEHVGIGSDFDGTPALPRGLEDVSKFPDLVKELLRRGLNEAQVQKIIGGNLLRVWKRVEEVGAEMLSEGVLPMEDDI